MAGSEMAGRMGGGVLQRRAFVFAVLFLSEVRLVLQGFLFQLRLLLVRERLRLRTIFIGLSGLLLLLLLRLRILFLGIVAVRGNLIRPAPRQCFPILGKRECETT